MSFEKCKQSCIEAINSYLRSKTLFNIVHRHHHVGRAERVGYCLGISQTIEELEYLIKNELSLFETGKSIKVPSLSSWAISNYRATGHFSERIVNTKATGELYSSEYYHRLKDAENEIEILKEENLSNQNDVFLSAQQISIFPKARKIGDFSIKAKNDDSCANAAVCGLLEIGKIPLTDQEVETIANYDFSTKVTIRKFILKYFKIIDGYTNYFSPENQNNSNDSIQSNSYVLKKSRYEKMQDQLNIKGALGVFYTSYGRLHDGRPGHAGFMCHDKKSIWITYSRYSTETKKARYNWISLNPNILNSTVHIAEINISTLYLESFPVFAKA